MRALFFRISARGAPLAAAKGRRCNELYWSRAEKPRGQLDGAVHPVPRRGARRDIMNFWIRCADIKGCQRKNKTIHTSLI